MENIKVKVESNIDELVSLFSELGCKYFNYTCSVKNYMIFQNGKCFFVKSKKEFNMCDCKELTIPQLKDMVALKRNSIDDATHKSGNHKYYLTGSEFYKYFNNKWVNVDEFVDGISFEPIEKKEITIEDLKESMKENNGKIIAMKEFLVNRDNKWTLQLLDSDTEENSYRVAVPTGAVGFIFNEYNHHHHHFTNNEGYLMSLSDINEGDGYWYLDESGYKNLDSSVYLWRRSEAESLNDKYAEIEKVRQDNVKVTIDELKHRVDDKVNNPSHYSDSTIECIDAMEAMLSPQEFIGYLRGNVFKYQWRYQKKNGIEDLKKYEWYLKKLIEKEIKNEDE